MVTPENSHESLQPKDRNLKVGYSHLLDATVGDATQVQSPLPPAPSSAMPSLRESNRPVLHKRKRQSYDPQRRSEVAAVRRAGACKGCHQKKIRCPHALQPRPTSELATQGTAPRLQNSISQDLSTVPGLCSTSPVSPSEDSSVTTSVSVPFFKGANQFSAHQWGQLDIIMDNPGHSHMYAKHFSAQGASNRPANPAIFAAEYVDQNLNSFSQRSIDSQITSYLQTRENEQKSMVPTCMPHFPGDNEPWDQNTGYEIKLASHSRYQRIPQSFAADINANQQTLTASQASPSDCGSLAASTLPYSHGYYDAHIQKSEMTSGNSQIGIPSMVRRSPPFATFHYTSLGAHIAPGDLSYNSMAPEGLEALPPRSFDTKMTGSVADATELMSPIAILSQHSPTPDLQDEIFSGSSQPYLLSSVYKDNAIPGGNFAPGCNSNTLEGCDMPLPSTIGVDLMLIRPHDVVSPQSFHPSDQISNKPNIFTVPGHSTDHHVGSPNLIYVQSHDMHNSSFLSDDFESSNSLRGPPSVRYNYPPLQIQPQKEPIFHSSRSSLVSSNFQSGSSPSLTQSPNVWQMRLLCPTPGKSVTSKEVDGFMEYNIMEQEGYG